MAKYLARSCPRCNGYLGIVLREPGRNVPLQAVNGHRRRRRSILPSRMSSRSCLESDPP